MYTVDLHTHTRFFHGFPRIARRYDPVGVRLLSAVAAVRGLDGFVTTNHDEGREFSTARGPAVIPGIEVTTSDGHMLIVGPDPPERTEPGELSPAEAVDLARERGCATVVAHPYRNSTVREAPARFDAIEINGKGLDHERVARLAGRLDLPLVGGSDAHYPIEIGRAFTRVEADELTPESLVAAIRDGRVEAFVDESLPYRLLRAVYNFNHGRKGWFDRPTPPGVGTPPGEDDPEMGDGIAPSE